jgi:hypothetical protein
MSASSCCQRAGGHRLPWVAGAHIPVVSCRHGAFWRLTRWPRRIGRTYFAASS